MTSKSLIRSHRPDLIQLVSRMSLPDGSLNETPSTNSLKSAKCAIGTRGGLLRLKSITDVVSTLDTRQLTLQEWSQLAFLRITIGKLLKLKPLPPRPRKRKTSGKPRFAGSRRK